MSRRSSLSATVVPTAAEHLPDPSADNSVHVATTEQRVEVAPENQVSVTDLQTSSASQASVTTAPVVVDAQQQVPAAKPCPGSPLAIAQSIHQNMHATAKRVKNYRALVNSFKHMQPFSRSADGSYPAKVVCVLCTAGKPTSVFFPCQHMCVCNKCIASNDMTPDFSTSFERCVCPVCRTSIRLILPHTGNEEETYWTWVLSTKTPLPTEFAKGFKNAGKKLSEDSTAESRISTVASISTHPSVDATIDAPIQRPVRGSSWTPTLAKRASAYRLGASKKQESCVIL